MSTETPTLSDVIDLHIALDRATAFHAVPGRVKSYDAAKQTAEIEPMTKVVSRNADDDRIVDTLPVLSGVPVEWPRGGGYFMTMPLVAGDSGLLLFTDTDLGAWRDSGQVSDPGDERRHALGGAVFRPGLETVARALVGVSGAHLVIGKEGGPAIHIDGSTVQLGAAGGQFVALANLVTTQLNTLKSAISGAAVVAGDGGASFKAAIIVALSAWPGGVAATLTKAT